MPFGLTNAPAVFQALVKDVLRDFHNQSEEAEFLSGQVGTVFHLIPVYHHLGARVQEPQA